MRREQRRGTAGAVRLAYDSGGLDDDFPGAVRRFLAPGRPGRGPAGCAYTRRAGADDGVPQQRSVGRQQRVFDGRRVTRYEKGLSEPPPEMMWIDYGLLALSSELVGARIPHGEVCDLAPLCSALADEGLLAGLEVSERFYEIGSPAGRAELDSLLSSRAD